MCVCVCVCVCGVCVFEHDYLSLHFCPQDYFYSMSCWHLGHCVIVNNVQEEMPETVQEVAVLQKACKAIGFDVTVYTDQDLEVHTFF